MDIISESCIRKNGHFTDKDICLERSAGVFAIPKKYRAGIKQKTPTSCDVRVSYKSVAATYSPTWWGSTIGDGELNFSVRNGKRWILTAITATICF